MFPMGSLRVSAFVTAGFAAASHPSSVNEFTLHNSAQKQWIPEEAGMMARPAPA